MRRLSDDCDLSGVVRPGDRLVVGHACGEPLTLTEALVAQRAVLGPLSLFMASSFSQTFQIEHADHIRFSSMGAIGGLGRLARAGVLDIVPCHIGQVGRFLRDGTIGCDVALVQISPAGPDGTHSPGLIADHILAAVESARTVVAEISDRIPWVPCDRPIRSDQIDWFVQTSRSAVVIAASEPSDVDRAIARHAGAFIGDGATLQMGIGAVPDAITRLLVDRRDLGIHSGMIGDGVVDLMEAGVVNNVRKPIEPGVTITGALIGGERLYRFADRNGAIGLRDARVTHGEEILAGLPNLVSINSAIEIDLTGQVNAEQTGDAYLGATGGQVDFVRAAARAATGRSIIALPASARAGAVSRIVRTLSGPVTTARSEVDVVVTQNGAAELKGRSIRDRVAAMIAIADPAFREALDRDAHDLLKRGY